MKCVRPFLKFYLGEASELYGNLENVGEMDDWPAVIFSLVCLNSFNDGQSLKL